MVIDKPVFEKGKYCLVRTKTRVFISFPCLSTKTLQVLDIYPHVFSNTPACIVYVGTTRRNNCIRFSSETIKSVNHVSELHVKLEVNHQIAELLRLQFIEPSSSLIASPIVCILRHKNSKQGMRIAIDSRYVNWYTLPDATP